MMPYVRQTNIRMPGEEREDGYARVDAANVSTTFPQNYRNSAYRILRANRRPIRIATVRGLPATVAHYRMRWAPSERVKHHPAHMSPQTTSILS
jgi:hypothetical protein